MTTPANTVEFKSTADVIKFLATTNYFKMDRDLDRAIRHSIERSKSRLDPKQYKLRKQAHAEYYEFIFTYVRPIREVRKIDVSDIWDVLWIKCRYEDDRRMEVITEIYNNWDRRFEIMSGHIKAYRDAMEAKRVPLP